MQKLSTAHDVVDALGGMDAVVKLTGANIKSVYNWVGRFGSFPARFHHTMQQALKKKNATAPASLWNQYPGK